VAKDITLRIQYSPLDDVDFAIGNFDPNEPPPEMPLVLMSALL
jgi:hypothetical protein